MIVACPNCAAEYNVPDAKMPPRGRRLRCAGCTQSWHATPPNAGAALADIGLRPEADQPGAEGPASSHPAAVSPPSPRPSSTLFVPPPEGEFAGLAARSHAPPQRRFGIGGGWVTLLLAWSGSLGLICGAAALALAKRDAAVAAWPRSLVLYHALDRVLSPDGAAAPAATAASPATSPPASTPG